MDLPTKARRNAHGDDAACQRAVIGMILVTGGAPFSVEGLFGTKDGIAGDFMLPDFCRPVCDYFPWFDGVLPPLLSC